MINTIFYILFVDMLSVCAVNAGKEPDRKQKPPIISTYRYFSMYIYRLY